MGTKASKVAEEQQSIGVNADETRSSYGATDNVQTAGEIDESGRTVSATPNELATKTEPSQADHKSAGMDYDTPSEQPVAADSKTTKLADENYSSFEYDPDFKGPIKQRSCTDIVCFLLFFLFLGGWAFIGYLGYIYGDPEALLVPTDSRGRKCGIHPEVKDMHKLFFFDITQCINPLVLVLGCPTQQVCVKECPKHNKYFINPCDEDARKHMYCVPNVNATDKSNDGTFKRTCSDLLKKDCARYTFHSIAVYGRCMPSISKNQSSNGDVLDDFGKVIPGLSLQNLTKGIENLGAFVALQGFGQSVWRDYNASWYVIVGALLACMVISFLWVVLMRWFAGVLVWTSLFGSLAGIVYGCVYTYLRYDELRHLESSDQPPPIEALSVGLASILESKNTWLVFFIALAVVGSVLLLLALVLCKRLRIAIEVIVEASKAVSSTMFSLLFPVVPWILQSGAILIFVAMSLYIASMSTKEYRISNMPESCNQSCPGLEMYEICAPEDFNTQCSCDEAVCSFYSYRKYKAVPYLQLYNLFALLWMLFFAAAFGEMVLAGAFAAWYFTFDKSKNLPMYPLTGSTYRTVRYHVGTLAFGSLIIAIVRLIRLVLDYVEKKCKQYPGNEVAECVLRACKCCMWCLEKFMKFINRNAYIMCAIYGKNFCKSARDAFSLLLRNVLRVLAVNSVCEFLLLLGKLLITVAVTVGSFYFLDNRIDGLESVVPATNNSWVMVLTVAIGCYFITSLFFSVYAMAIDTLFLCFLEDIERNDGSKEKPYYMSKNLMKLIGKKNR